MNRRKGRICISSTEVSHFSPFNSCSSFFLFICAPTQASRHGRYSGAIGCIGTRPKWTLALPLTPALREVSQASVHRCIPFFDQGKGLQYLCMHVTKRCIVVQSIRNNFIDMCTCRLRPRSRLLKHCLCRGWWAVVFIAVQRAVALDLRPPPLFSTVTCSQIRSSPMTQKERNKAVIHCSMCFLLVPGY